MKEVEKLLSMNNTKHNFGHLIVLIGTDGVGKSEFLSKINSRINNYNASHNDRDTDSDEESDNRLKEVTDRVHTEVFLIEGSENDRHTLYSAWRPIFSKLLYHKDPIDEIDLSNRETSDLYFSCKGRKQQNIMNSIFHDNSSKYVKQVADDSNHSNRHRSIDLNENKTKLLNIISQLIDCGTSEEEFLKLVEVIPSLKIESILDEIKCRNGTKLTASKEDMKNEDSIKTGSSKETIIDPNSKNGGTKDKSQGKKTLLLKRRSLVRRHSWNTNKNISPAKKYTEIDHQNTLNGIAEFLPHDVSINTTNGLGRRMSYRSNIEMSEEYIKSLIESRDSVARWIGVFDKNPLTKFMEQRTTDILAHILILLLNFRLNSNKKNSFCRNKIAILIDNGEHLDHGSLDLLIAIAGALPCKCNIVVTIRGDANSNLGTLNASGSEAYYDPQDYMAYIERINKTLINDLLRPLSSCEIELKPLKFKQVFPLFNDYFRDKYDGRSIIKSVLEHTWLQMHGNIRESFVYLDGLIEDGLLEEGLSRGKRVFKPSKKYVVLKAGAKGSKYQNTTVVQLSSLSQIPLFICQLLSVFGVSLSFKTLVSLQLYCLPPVPLTEGDIEKYLKDLLDYGVLRHDRVTKSYHFTSPKVRDQLFSSLTFSDRTKMHLGIIAYYNKSFGESIKEFYSILGHHYEGSQDYASAIKYYEDASIDEYTDGNYRDAILNFSNLIRLAKKKKKVCKHTKLFKTVKSTTLCICTWLGYFAASECHVLHFHNSLKLLDRAMDILSLHSICNNPMFFCSRMAQRTRLIQQIKSMQGKVKSYLHSKIVKNKSLNMRGMEQEIFEDFPPLGWKPVESENLINLD
jgi:hypothetical protein